MTTVVKAKRALEVLGGAYDPEAHGAICSKCPAGGPDRKFCPPQAPEAGGRAQLIIVGESPGRRELIEKKPFIGQSGKMLDRALGEAISNNSLSGETMRSRAWITNAALCRCDHDVDNDDAAACCAPRLYNEIAALPKDAPILALGKPAARSLLGMNGILKVRGFVFETKPILETSLKAAKRALEKENDKSKKFLLRLKIETLVGRQKIAGRTVLPTIHPAFVLRSDTWLPIFERDIDRFVRLYRARLTGKGFPLADETGKYKVTAKPSQIKKALAEMNVEVSFDIETDGIDPLTAPVLCAAVSDGVRTVVIQPWDATRHAKLLSDAFASRSVGGHNVFAFDILALEREGVVFPGREQIWDSLLAHHAYASHLPQGLAQVVSYYLDSGPWKIKFGRKGGDEKGLLPAQMTPEDRAHYNAADARLNMRAWKGMQSDLGEEQLIYQHDKQNAIMCQALQKTGIAVDLEKREWLSGALKRRAARLLYRMRKLTGNKNFHPNKTADVRKALFGKFKAPALFATPTGLPSTGVIALNALATQQSRAGKLTRFILKYRKAHKIRSTYVDSLVIRDGRAYFSWKCFGTVSGRWSCRFMTLPRVKNPKKPVLEDRIRDLFVAPLGKKFVYFDLSQAEMRIAANLSGDQNFMAICLQKDVHSANAMLLFGSASPEYADAITNDPKGRGKFFRDVAKNVGFAVNYLAGADTLLKRLNSEKLPQPVTLKTVNHMLAVLHEQFKTHFKFIDGNIRRCQTEGYLRTPVLGRIRWFGWVPVAAELANFPVQSTVADLMNERLWEIFNRLPAGCRLVAQIHDAGMFECDDGAPVEAMKKLIKEVWDRPVVLSEKLGSRTFVLPIDLKEGTRMNEVA